MNKWTKEYVEKLCWQGLKNYYDLVHKEPDLTKPILLPWQLERCFGDLIFRE